MFWNRENDHGSKQAQKVARHDHYRQLFTINLMSMHSESHASIESRKMEEEYPLINMEKLYWWTIINNERNLGSTNTYWPMAQLKTSLGIS